MESDRFGIKLFTRENITRVLLLILLLGVASYLRFTNLGYSEFQDDEKKSMVRTNKYDDVAEFLLNQRKGPMQFIVTSAVLAITHDRQNEIAFRLPFTIFNLISVVIFFLILKKLDFSDLSAFMGSFIYLANGFIVAFARISQYQSLNLLFSLLSLYFAICLYKTNKKFTLYSILTVISFSVSFLSHWDAIFFIIPISYYIYKLLTRQDLEYSLKIKITKIAIATGCLLVLPFFIPYIFTLLNNNSNLSYLNKRIGLSQYNFLKHLKIFELYNPYITLPLLLTTAAFSILKIKKASMYIVWFLINYTLIKLFMDKPGTHIYNYVIPLFFLASFGINNITEFVYKLKFVGKSLNFVIISALVLMSAYIYFQSYTLFVDHKIEYPWQEKPILVNKFVNFVAKDYEDTEVLTFGFPHFRNWKKVASIINADNPECTYITNEGKEISQIYLPDNYGMFPKPRCLYIAVVTRPFINQRDGAVFAETSRKTPVYIYQNNNEKLLKLYKIR